MVRRLLVGYLSITALMLLVLEVPFGFVIYRLERNALVAGVQHDAATIALYAEQKLETNDSSGLAELAADYRRQTNGGRVVIVDRNGLAKADSAPLDSEPENFASRPEVAIALRGRESHGFRSSKTLHTSLLYVAQPVLTAGIIRGAVRITYPAAYYDRIVYRGWAALVAIGVIVLGIVTVVSFRVARAVTAPLRDLEDASTRVGEGDLSARSPVPEGPHELTVLTRSFNDTAAKLERLVDSQRAFVADASHQLRTPLAALRLRLEILEDAVPKRGREDYDAAVQEVHRLSRLVDGLLALARAENMPAAVVPVDVGAVAEGRRANWSPFAAEHDVALVTSVAPGEMGLLTPGNLEQVLDNLIANAIDIAPAGSTVTVELRRTPEWLEVHVIDEGPGMSPERRATAFTRFWKAPDTEKRVGGFGIGLAIVKQLVNVDGGEVELLEAPSGGVDAVVRVRPALRAKGGRGDTPAPGTHAPRRRRAAASAGPSPGDGADS